MPPNLPERPERAHLGRSSPIPTRLRHITRLHPGQADHGMKWTSGGEILPSFVPFLGWGGVHLTHRPIPVGVPHTPPHPNLAAPIWA